MFFYSTFEGEKKVCMLIYTVHFFSRCCWSTIAQWLFNSSVLSGSFSKSHQRCANKRTDAQGQWAEVKIQASHHSAKDKRSSLLFERGKRGERKKSTIDSELPIIGTLINAERSVNHCMCIQTLYHIVSRQFGRQLAFPLSLSHSPSLFPTVREEFIGSLWTGWRNLSFAR